MKIENWCNRMGKLVQLTDGQFISLRTKIIANCPYGEQHFCDGSINMGIRNQAKENKPRCEHFKNGECALMIHIC